LKSGASECCNSSKVKKKIGGGSNPAAPFFYINSGRPGPENTLKYSLCICEIAVYFEHGYKMRLWTGDSSREGIGFGRVGFARYLQVLRQRRATFQNG
jgi:hypothetical protein